MSVPGDLHWSRYKFPESLFGYGAWIVVLGFLAFSKLALDSIELARLARVLVACAA